MHNFLERHSKHFTLLIYAKYINLADYEHQNQSKVSFKTQIGEIE